MFHVLGGGERKYAIHGAAELALSRDMMVGYWLAFAATGDPNNGASNNSASSGAGAGGGGGGSGGGGGGGGAPPRWVAWSNATAAVMVLGTADTASAAGTANSSSMAGYRKELCDFWDGAPREQTPISQHRDRNRIRGGDW